MFQKVHLFRKEKRSIFLLFMFKKIYSKNTSSWNRNREIKWNTTNRLQRIPPVHLVGEGSCKLGWRLNFEGFVVGRQLHQSDGSNGRKDVASKRLRLILMVNWQWGLRVTRNEICWGAKHSTQMGLSVSMVLITCVAGRSRAGGGSESSTRLLSKYIIIGSKVDGWNYKISIVLVWIILQRCPLRKFFLPFVEYLLWQAWQASDKQSCSLKGTTTFTIYLARTNSRFCWGGHEHLWLDAMLCRRPEECNKYVDMLLGCISYFYKAHKV